MKNELNLLREILVKQLETHIELRDLLVRVHESFAQFAAEEIDEANKIAETLRMRAAALEEARQRVVEMIARTAGRPAEELSLQAIVAMAPPALKRDLHTLRRQLTAVVIQINEQNQRNIVVAQASYASVQGLFHVLMQLTQKPLTYEPPKGASARR
ncbi:flagellar protein FlgN [bacterium]|nr:flagellar protein FlgN [bacterium]